MNILFPKGPRFGRLCLMAAPADQQFGRPFILNGGNIRAFIDQLAHFEGKYLFHRPTGRLGLSLGLDVKHRLMGQLLYDKPKQLDLFGAYISFRKSSAGIIFELHGASGTFGKPKDMDIRLAASRIAELLAICGMTSLIEFLPLSTAISANR